MRIIKLTVNADDRYCIKCNYILSFIDDEIQTPCDPTFAPVESDIDDCTPPKQTNVSF